MRWLKQRKNSSPRAIESFELYHTKTSLRAVYVRGRSSRSGNNNGYMVGKIEKCFDFFRVLLYIGGNRSMAPCAIEPVICEEKSPTNSSSEETE